MKLFYLLSLCLLALPVHAEWIIKQTDLQVKDKITFTEEASLYTGDTIIHDNEIEPKPGHKYVLAFIEVENQDTSKPPFNSKEFYITANNNTYNRILNDTFLLEYNLKPFTKLNIKKGKHYGVLVFEIPIKDLKLTPILKHKEYQIKK